MRPREVRNYSSSTITQSENFIFSAEPVLLIVSTLLKKSVPFDD